jgi:hypothetical protein
MECNSFTLEKIGESDSPAFRDHLAGCAACARDLEELREVRALYRAASTETYPGGIPSLRSFRTGWVPMAAAAAVLVMVFGLILGGPREDPAKKNELVKGAVLVVRVPLEPWAADAQIQTAMDDCWRMLDHLEDKR